MTRADDAKSQCRQQYPTVTATPREHAGPVRELLVEDYPTKSIAMRQ